MSVYYLLEYFLFKKRYMMVLRLLSVTQKKNLMNLRFKFSYKSNKIHVIQHKTIICTSKILYKHTITVILMLHIIFFLTVVNIIMIRKTHIFVKHFPWEVFSIQHLRRTPIKHTTSRLS